MTSTDECGGRFLDCARWNDVSCSRGGAARWAVCVAGCEAVEVLDSQTVRIGARPLKEKLSRSMDRTVMYMKATFRWSNPKSFR